jgi:hypothetical protein
MERAVAELKERVEVLEATMARPMPLPPREVAAKRPTPFQQYQARKAAEETQADAEA